MADDKIKIICTRCKNPFREKAREMRDGFQSQCPHCYRMITFDRDSQDPGVMRALRAARQLRRVLAESEAVPASQASKGHRSGGRGERLSERGHYDDSDR